MIRYSAGRTSKGVISIGAPLLARAGPPELLAPAAA